MQFAAGASLPPGEYTLRLAAADGERAGSVEHRFAPRCSASGGVTFSDLLAGGPTSARELLNPTVGYVVNFGSLHGYLEAYGEQPEPSPCEYEIATGPTSPAPLSPTCPDGYGGDDRMIFTQSMAVQQLPPGPYVLRALVSAAASRSRRCPAVSSSRRRPC